MNTDWESLWQEGDTGWDLGKPAPPLQRSLREMAAGTRLLVPGAGAGHDPIAAAKVGHKVTAIDLAATACERMRKNSMYIDLEIICGDALEYAPDEPFDDVLEYTFLVALEPIDRQKWAEAQHRFIRPGGRLHALVFPFGRPHSEGGPPWGLTCEDVLRLLPNWEIIIDEEPLDSVERRQGHERLLVLQR